jgi:hypothetical protein
MPAAILIQIDAYDPVAAAAVTIRLASQDDDRLCMLNGLEWLPELQKLPILAYDFFSGQFDGAVSTPGSQIAFGVRPWPNLPRWSFADARIQIWVGELGAAWAGYTKRFDGRVTAQPNVSNGLATLAFAVDDGWLDDALLTTYAGNGGGEGPAALKGTEKQLAIGAPRYVPGVLIDAVNLIYQISGYGAIEDVEAALDGLVRYPASVGNLSNHAGLLSASIPAGRFATCLAEGKVRFGAPPFGKVSFLVRGDKAGPDGWVRTPGKISRRIALLSGGTGKIDDASLNALDASRPDNCSLLVPAQTNARAVLQEFAASVNAVAGVTHLGKLFIAAVSIGAPVLTLQADGSAFPIVASVDQVPGGAPFWRIALSAERTWDVHAPGDYVSIDAFPGTIGFEQLTGGIPGPDANRVRFSRTESGTDGWQVLNNLASLPLTLTADNAYGTRYIRAESSSGVAGQFHSIGTALDSKYLIPVTPGERLSVRAGIELQNVLMWDFVAGWHDETGAAISGVGGLTVLQSGGAGTVPYGTRIGDFVIVPGGVRFARIELYHHAANNGYVSTIITEPMVAGASATQTVHPSFAPGPSGEYGATRNAPKGIYSNAAIYAPGDTVVWTDGKGYGRIDSGPTVGVAPSDGSKWAIYVDKGADGANGTDGLNGVDGIDGNDGKLIEFAWKRAASLPATPTGNGIPSGWSDDPPSGSDPLWMSKAKQELDGTLVSGESWSTPIRHDGPAGANGANGINGANGLDGQDGISIDPIAPFSVRCTSAETPKAGELALITGTIVLRKAGVVQTAGVTYAIVGSPVGFTGLSLAGSTFGPPSGMTARNASATLRATYLGVNYDTVLRASKSLDGNAANSNSAPITSVPASATYAVAAAALDISVPASTSFSADANLSYGPTTTGLYTCQIKLTYQNITDGGAEIDFPTTGTHPATGGSANTSDPEAVATGTESASNSTGGTKVFRIRVYARRAAGSGSISGGNISGTVAARV